MPTIVVDQTLTATRIPPGEAAGGMLQKSKRLSHRGPPSFLLECHDRTLVAAFSLLPKTKVRNETILPCNLSKVLVPTELCIKTSSIHSRSSFDLSCVCPTLTSRFTAFSVLTVNHQTQCFEAVREGGCFRPF